MKKIFISLIVLLSGALLTNAYFLESLEAAKFLAQKGIIVEKQNPGDYNLDSYVLRQEVAAVARGVAGLEKKSKCDNEFSDVSISKPNSWICYTAEALRDANIIAKNNYFNPEQKITKAEALGMMVKAAGFDYSYNPSLGSSWQKQLVDYAKFKGIVSNFTDYNTLATRGWIFEIGKKSIELVKNGKTTQDGNVEMDEDVKQILEDLFSQ